MLYALLIFHFTFFTFILVRVYGENGGRPRFRCPRAHELDEGCIYKGKFINLSRCQELCYNFFRNELIEGSVEAICENSAECECLTQPPDDVDEEFSIIRSLVDLEEGRTGTPNPSGVQPNEVRCGYYDTLITARECFEFCTRVQNSRGNIANPAFVCRENSRCKCEVAEGDVLYVNLDTLEARYRHEDERGAAANLWLWIEMHDQFTDPWSELNNPNNIVARD